MLNVACQVQVDELNLSQIGPKFEHNDVFPARTNTEFVEVSVRNRRSSVSLPL